MLTIYAPTDKPQSKCWRVFDGIKQSWPEAVTVIDNSASEATAPAMFWGFVNNNTQLIHQLELVDQDYYFTDTPYFGRFNNTNLTDTNHYWRICKNRIHAQFINLILISNNVLTIKVNTFYSVLVQQGWTIIYTRLIGWLTP
jgi:hypothetical protein